MWKTKRREKSGKWRMTAEALPATDPVVSLLVGCQHLPSCFLALAGRVWEASHTLIQIAFCYSPSELSHLGSHGGLAEACVSIFKTTIDVEKCEKNCKDQVLWQRTFGLLGTFKRCQVPSGSSGLILLSTKSKQHSTELCNLF